MFIVTEYAALKHNDRKYSVNLDPRCMVGRIYGTTSCGFHGFREDFFKFFPILNQ